MCKFSNSVNEGLSVGVVGTDGLWFLLEGKHTKIQSKRNDDY